MLKKSKDVFWPPFLASRPMITIERFLEIYYTDFAISQDFTVTKDFFVSIETFFSHSCCTFDFHFRCYFLSLAIRKCVENYGVGKRRSLCIADMPEVN